MKNALLLSILAGGVAGLVGASAATLLVTGTEAAPSGAVAQRSPEGAPVAAPSAELQKKLDALEVQNKMLAERLRKLEERPVTAEGRQPVAATPDPALVRLEDQMRQLLAAMTDSDSPLPEGLAASFREVYEDIQDEERQEREERMAEMRQAEFESRMQRYTAELGLDEYQSNEMRVVLQSQQERRDQLFVDARENGNWLTLREDMRTIRDETNSALGNLLTADQLERYQELDRRRFGFGGGPGGGRGGAPQDGAQGQGGGGDRRRR